LLNIIKVKTMNAKQVLNKIITLLTKDEVELTYAKLADGTIVESPTFDVGEDLMVIGEDGEKTPAPDGFHDLKLEGEEGQEVYIKVKTEGGKIVERENVEFADAETAEVKDLPQTNINEKANEVKDIKSPASDAKGTKTSSMMAEVTEEAEDDIPQVGDGVPADIKEGEDTPMTMGDMQKKMEEMAYRIEEMEKKMTEMAEPKMKEEVVDKSAEIKDESSEIAEEEELAKLDGAPVESATKFSTDKSKNVYGKKAMNSQSSFLSKLYK
jgi:hypothetical protein